MPPQGSTAFTDSGWQFVLAHGDASAEADNEVCQTKLAVAESAPLSLASAKSDKQLVSDVSFGVFDTFLNLIWMASSRLRLSNFPNLREPVFMRFLNCFAFTNFKGFDFDMSYAIFRIQKLEGSVAGIQEEPAHRLRHAFASSFFALLLSHHIRGRHFLHSIICHYKITGKTIGLKITAI